MTSIAIEYFCLDLVCSAQRLLSILWSDFRLTSTMNTPDLNDRKLGCKAIQKDQLNASETVVTRLHGYLDISSRSILLCACSVAVQLI